jgi:membrane-bound serine protease (ClpP class)
MMSRYSILRFLLAFMLAVPAVTQAAAPVLVLTVEGAIGPAAADYVKRGIDHAEKDGAQLLVMRIDTPGGLDTSMRTIIKAILQSPVPVAAYVAPSGARAASAGTYILYASHIAAMAPGTNLGAATPVQIGGPMQPDKPEPARRDERKGKDDDKLPGEPSTSTMTRKQVNDAAAYLRGLAQMRGRNMDWAERAVRESVSLSAEDALQMHVVDHVAADLDALLKQLDRKKVRLMEQDRVLQTAGAPVVRYEPDWRVRVLAVITDPSIALLLLTIGIYGLIFEFMNPGVVFPGVLGAISLLLALYALQLLPVNFAGLALILLGLAFMAAEAFFPSFGALGLGGIASFVVGALILIDTELPGFGIPVGLIVLVALTSALLIAGIVGVALRTRRRAVVSGANTLIGLAGEVVDEGWARIQGENWRVVSDTPLRRGQRVQVMARDGLLLKVAPVDDMKKGE